MLSFCSLLTELSPFTFTFTVLRLYCQCVSSQYTNTFPHHLCISSTLSPTKPHTSHAVPSRFKYQHIAKPHHYTLSRLSPRYQPIVNLHLTLSPGNEQHLQQPHTMSAQTTLLAIIALPTLVTAQPVPRSVFSTKNSLDNAAWLLICYDLLAFGLLLALWFWNTLNRRIEEMRQEQEQEEFEMQVLGERERSESVEREMRRMGLI
jgi:hypothetical protein